MSATPGTKAWMPSKGECGHDLSGAVVIEDDRYIKWFCKQCKHWVGYWCRSCGEQFSGKEPPSRGVCDACWRGMRLPSKRENRREEKRVIAWLTERGYSIEKVKP